MQEYGLFTGEWRQFWARWNGVIEKFPSLKESVLDRMGISVQEEVRRQVKASGVQDSAGRVALWQNRYVGSKHGYVAVRSDSVEVMSGGGNRKPVNAGAITNFLTSGHRVRGPSGRAKRYVNRAEKTRVPGFAFYKTSAGYADRIAVAEAERFLEELAVELK